MDPDLENTYLVLLGLSEKFQNDPYNNCLLSLKCLKAILNLPVEPEIHYSVYLKIGKILYFTYNDLDISKTYFEKSVRTKYSSAIFLAKIYQSEGSYHDAERLLKQCISLSKDNSLWYSVFITELSQTYLKKKDVQKSIICLENGIEFSKGYPYEHTIFMQLSLAIVSLITNDIRKLEVTLDLLNVLLKKVQNSIKKESLTLYTLLIQILHHLVQGKGKSVKPYLKKLQQILQSYTSRSEEDDDTLDILWLPRPYIILMSYLLIVVHALQVGYMERALKYIDKGLAQIDILKADYLSQNDRIKTLDFSDNPLSRINVLYKFESAFREYAIVSNLVTGKYSSAIKEIQMRFFYEPTGIVIKRDVDWNYKTRLHTFLGLYSLATKEYEKSQTHFNFIRLQTADPENDNNTSYQSTKCKIFCSFNLLLMYLHLNRHNYNSASSINSVSNSNLETEIRRILETLNPDVISEIAPYIYKSAANFVYSLWHFCKRDFNEAKKYLREALKMSNAEDVNRMTAFSLLLLGQIFIHSQNFQDCLTMLNPGCQLSVKIQDPCSQIWASVLYKQMYQATGNESQFKESLELTTKLSETFAKEYQDAITSQEHKKLIQHF
ncbi:unnamed protein product [Gordionus sp. m RMFG-2023]